MPAERYHIDRPLEANNTVLLKDNEFHHLVRVMRSRVGDSVELVNGQGVLACATVREIFKDGVTLSVEEVQRETRSKPTIILAQAIPKPNRLDFILEKGTELGVDEFWLFPGKTSVKKDFSDNQTERCQFQILAAMKQCGRLFAPVIKLKPPLENWADITGAAFFGDIEPNAPLFSDCLNTTPLTSPLLFFVGPEAGLSQGEIIFLRKHGVQGVKLHQNILRTETASLAALSLIYFYTQSTGR
jgi:16S rRNA (uracil1498-N3)-methyltransferase